MQAKFIFSLILAVLVAIFAIQNSAAVPVNFIVYHLEISQALIILISAIIGAIIAFSLGLMKQFNMNKAIKEKDKQIRNLEMSVAKLEIENGELHTKKAMSLDSETPNLDTSKGLDDI
ncbi:lipopolysaccharide assembly protein LapA domain-containing protein [Acetoanaerobium sticklandii]|uniref:lipopolysaccharide assembly protein LapA domain-containing protein n=1 Tax=Acetoanaerobium sticklandii TaxID=1511 RepID=UPI003A91712D